MKDKPITAIFDIDGTLANTDHRQHLAQEKDWTKFFEKMVDDKPHPHICRILEMHQSFGDYIILCTGREEIYRETTIKWLKDNGIKWDSLLMRRKKDYRKDTEVKKEMYNNFIGPYFNVQFIYDDRNSVVEMWRELGLKCLQVAPGDF